MTEKNSNRISLIIAILAIVLIIGGLYVLQRSLSSNSSKSSANSSKTISTQKSSGSKTTTVTPTTNSSTGKTNSSSPVTSGTVSTTATNQTPASASTNPEPAKAEPVKQIPTTSTSTQSSGTVQQTTPKAPLNQNELTAKYIGNNTFEIVDCGKTGGVYCKAPYKVYISNQVANNVGPLTNDKTYKFDATWNEDQNGILFSNIQTILEVK